MRTQTKETIANLKASLQEERRRATLMNGDLHQLKEAREALEFQLAKAEAEIAENRARRKEAARVIARRDAEIQARFQELAILERQILESSLSWKLQHALRRLTSGRQFEASRPASS
jgi:DNA-binding SARP family transcriptional activator